MSQIRKTTSLQIVGIRADAYAADVTVVVKVAMANLCPLSRANIYSVLHIVLLSGILLSKIKM